MSTILISNVKRVEERKKKSCFFFAITDKRLLTVLFYEDNPASWIFELDFELDFELEFRVGFSSWISS